MLTYVYFLLWICSTFAEKEVYVRFQQKSETRTCQLPNEIDITLDEQLPRSHHLRLARNNDININLPVYSVTHEDGVPRYRTEYYTHQQDSAIYHDIVNGASVLIRCVNRINGTDWYWKLDGHVYIDSTNHRLEPVLENGEIRRHNKYQDQHVYRLSPIEEHHSCNFESDKFNRLPTSFHPKISKRKRRGVAVAPTPLKVDVAIFVDHKAYLTWLARQNNDDAKATEDIRIYFTQVIAGVNLRFRSMIPAVDVSILPISITIFKTTTTWIDGIVEDKDGIKQVDAGNVLNQLQTWIQSNFNNPYDHIMAFTGYDLFSSGNEQFTTGLANIGTLCKTDGTSTSVVEDSGGFQSIVTAAHELGHGMNVVHDGSDNNCRAEDRYIMSPRSDYTETPETLLNPWKFSSCSITQFQAFFQTILDDSAQSSCLTGKLSTTDIPDISDKMAGQVYGPDEQCRHIHGANSYVCRGISFGTGSDVCRKMFCSKTGSGTDVESCESITPAQGTSCGNKKWCIQGECVENEKAPTREGDCVYGDQDSAILNGVNCAYVRNDFNGYCYPEHKAFRERCCETCERIKTDNPVCEYGDIDTGCEAHKCGYINTVSKQLYDINCCGTCKYTGEVTTVPDTTPTPTTDATTPPSCADVPLIENQSCVSYISTKGERQCYNPAVESACCDTCTKKRRANPDCLYGDQKIDCNVTLCGRLIVGGTYDSVCCETCAEPTTTDASTTPVSEETTKSSDASTTSVSEETTKSSDALTTPVSQEITSVTDASTTPISQESTVQDATITVCSDGSGLEGLSCVLYIEQRGRSKCYDDTIFSACCKTCTALTDTSLTGCPFGDRDGLCSFIDFKPLTTCNDTIINKCCKSCHELVKPQVPANCVDGSGIGTLTCPEHVDKHGKRSCYESSVNKTCCKTCYRHGDLKTTGCMFGDRTPACSNMKAVDYVECNDFTKTHCCSTCLLLEEYNKNRETSAVSGIHLPSFSSWIVSFLIFSLCY